MRNGRFHPSKCRGKVQKMGVLYNNTSILPKCKAHLQKNLTPKAPFPLEWLLGLFVTLDEAFEIAVVF
jgi:hypothetical protein